MNLLAFTGKMGAGKSTAIEIYREMYPDKSIVLVKFADPIYDIQDAAYARIASVYERPAGFVKDRKFLQWIGTEWGRGLSQSLWRDIWKMGATWCLSNGYDVVCDDIRFDNEAEAVVEMGGKIIEIQAPDSQSRITTANGLSAHSSENGINPRFVSKVVLNDGNIMDFKNKLTDVLQFA